MISLIISWIKSPFVGLEAEASQESHGLVIGIKPPPDFPAKFNIKFLIGAYLRMNGANTSTFLCDIYKDGSDRKSVV